MLADSRKANNSGGDDDGRERETQGRQKEKSRSGLVPPFNLSTSPLVCLFVFNHLCFFASSLLFF